MKFPKTKIKNIVRHILNKNGFKAVKVFVNEPDETEYGNFYVVEVSMKEKLREKESNTLEFLIERSLYRKSLTKKELFASVYVY